MPKIVLCDNCQVGDVAILAKENGFGVEVQAFQKPEKLLANSIEEHERILSGITFRSMHGPFGDLNPGSHDSKIRAVTLERFEEGFAAATELKAYNLVLHNGYVPKTRSLTNWIPQAIDFWKKFIEGKSHMRFHIENLLELSPDVLLAVIDGIGSPNVDVCLDIGHAHCNSKYSVVDWIKCLQSKIGYVHIHDNHGENDEHLGLGKGNIHLPAVFEALKLYAPDSIWALEAHGLGVGESIDWLKNNSLLT